MRLFSLGNKIRLVSTMVWSNCDLPVSDVFLCKIGVSNPIFINLVVSISELVLAVLVSCTVLLMHELGLVRWYLELAPIWAIQF